MKTKEKQGTNPDASISLRLGLTNPGILLDLGGPLPSQSLKVSLVVLDILDGVTDNLQAQVAHIHSCHLTDSDGELLAILVDLLDGEGSHDGSLVSLLMKTREQTSKREGKKRKEEEEKEAHTRVREATFSIWSLFMPKKFPAATLTISSVLKIRTWATPLTVMGTPTFV